MAFVPKDPILYLMDPDKYLGEEVGWRSDSKDRNWRIDFLIWRGADLHRFDERGNAPIHTAILWGNTRVFRQLIEHGADPNQKNRHGDTALDLACAWIPNHVPVLIELGARTRTGNNACQADAADPTWPMAPPEHALLGTELCSSHTCD